MEDKIKIVYGAQRSDTTLTSVAKVYEEFISNNRSGKTKKLIEEVIAYHKDKPDSVIYVNSQDFKERILVEVPQANVKVLKTQPDKTYPNVFASPKNIVCKINLKAPYFDTYTKRSE